MKSNDWLAKPLLFLLLAIGGLVNGRAPQWHFIPCFHENISGVELVPASEIAENMQPDVVARHFGSLSEISRDEFLQARWRKAAFPHVDFTDVMKGYDTFGWYACTFDIPAAFRGMELLVDLGIIDDADETFINGVAVGKTGKVPGGSAWRTDRRYRIDGACLKPSGNVLAVHVWSHWGLGGIVGPPVFVFPLASREGQWQVAFLPNNADIDLNRVAKLDELTGWLGKCPGKPDVRNVPVLWKDLNGWPEQHDLAMFQLTLDMPDQAGKAFKRPLVLDIGPVFDVAAVFLNGKRIGLTGRFPFEDEPAFTEAGQRGQYLAEPDDWSWKGENRLTVVVYRERGGGGLPGVPGVMLSHPYFENSKEATERMFHSAALLIQSMQMKKAEKMLSNVHPVTDSERAWLLSMQAHCAFLQWADAGKGGDNPFLGKRTRKEKLLPAVLDNVRGILEKLPVEAPRQSAMQGFCRLLQLAEHDQTIADEVHARFPYFNCHRLRFPLDRTTQGDWPRNYGGAGWVLAAMGQTHDLASSASFRPLDYRLSVPGKRDYPCLWMPKRQFNVADGHALSIPDSNKLPRSMRKIMDVTAENDPQAYPLEKGRAASWWDDHGEMHPFDDEGPDLVLELKRPGFPACEGDSLVPVRNPCFVTVHHQDFDWRTTLHPRQQSVIVHDDKNRFLDAVWLGRTDKGVYTTFIMPPEGGLRIRSVKHRSACVALSGFFVDMHYPYKVSPTPFMASDILVRQFLREVPAALRADGEEYMHADMGACRVEAARRLLANPELLAKENRCAATMALAVLAVDSSFCFDEKIPCLLPAMQDMEASTLQLLQLYLKEFHVHPRWLPMIGQLLLKCRDK